jgi:RES domain-containing protein
VTPLPAPLDGRELVAWRLDDARFAATWDSGEGPYRVGGRWNGAGVRAVYCSIDPATAILEVAVHKGFQTLDRVPHVLTAMTISEPAGVRVVDPASIPNPDWLRPGFPSAGQQAFGTDLLAGSKFVVIPSAVSTRSWNLIFVGLAAAGAYAVRAQEPFALDPRLHPGAGGAPGV